MDPTVVAVEPSLFQTLSPYIDKALVAFIGLIMTGALELGRRHLGMAQTQVSQDAVNKAAASMTEAMLRKYGASLQTASVTASNPAVIEAADYVERRLPDSLKKLDMKSADVRDLMTTRINAGLAGSDLTEAPPRPVAVPRDIPALDPIPPEFPPDPTQKDDQTAETQFVAELRAFLEKHPDVFNQLKEPKI